MTADWEHRKQSVEWRIRVVGKTMTLFLFTAMIGAEASGVISAQRIEIYMVLVSIWLGATEKVQDLVDRVLKKK